MAALAAIRGAALNVRINAAGLADKSAAAPLLARAAEIVAEGETLQTQVLEAVNANIG
jgi:glutamate formiminotransferase/formiminotetrahydrofolate cyclodeaminase